jgi:RIO kinase 1
MDEEYGLLDTDDVNEVEGFGDEWEEIDVSDTEADRVARQRDREFEDFQKRIKDADQLKVEGEVFDEATLAAIYKLVQEGHITAFGGPLSTGKEANVFTALGGDEREVAVKIYRITNSNFRHMKDYMVGDPRFEGLRGDKKETVLAWTRKESSNLKRARTAGVRVPDPIAVERNVLVMEYLGTEGDDAQRAPTLAEAHLENPQTAFEVVREYMARLHVAGLVHGDLSEYNIVVHDGELVIIDLGQAVTIHHPNAGEFLDRDCHNVAAFFQRQGLDVTGDDLCAYVRERRATAEEST